MTNILRPKGRRSTPDQLIAMGVHLVYSEGTRTEPKYVDNIKGLISKKYNCKPNEVLIINATDDSSYNTKSLVDYAIKDVDKRLKKGEIINHVWIFYDKDDFPNDNFNNANNKIESLNNSSEADNNGFKYNTNNNISYHSCYSNECFELWLLEYFDYLDTNMNREDYISKINEKVRKSNGTFSYEKNSDNIHTILTDAGGSIDNAIRNSKKITEANKMKAPSTKVYEFAEYFKAYMK